MKGRLLLVDLTDCLYQQWVLEGRPAEITENFKDRLITRLINISDRFNATHAVCAADARTSWREEVVKGYRFNGNKLPIQIYMAQADLEKRVMALGWPKVLRHTQTEATDIIWRALEGTDSMKGLVRKVVTSDKRLLQWIGESTTIESFMVKFETERHKDISWLDFKYGIEPKQVADYLLMAGDPERSLAGVKGIGPKKAKWLLVKYKTLENIIKNAPEIRGKLGEVVSNCRHLLDEKVTLQGKVGLDMGMKFSEIKLADPSKDRGVEYI